MKFGYTILYVQDVARSIAFYEIAFGLKQKMITENGQYGEMETGETTLAFAEIESVRSILPQGFQENTLSHLPAAMEIGFVTDDVQTAFNTAVNTGAVIIAEPQVKPWGQTVAYVRDLDGMLVEICSPI